MLMFLQLGFVLKSLRASPSTTVYSIIAELFEARKQNKIIYSNRVVFFAFPVYIVSWASSQKPAIYPLHL